MRVLKCQGELLGLVPLQRLCNLSSWIHQDIPLPTPVGSIATVAARPVTQYKCWSDGSFTQPDQGGAAYCLNMGSRLIQYGLTYHSNAHSPFHMETAALLQAVQVAQARSLPDCTFYVDSELLVKTIDAPDALQYADWQSYSELMQLIHILITHPTYKCVYIPREEINLAHELANLARLNRFDYIGYTYPLFLTQ